MAEAERDTDVGPGTDRSPALAPNATSANAPSTSPTSGSPTSSAARPASGADSTPGSDTLLSVPASATREDLALDHRLAACERRLDEVDARLASLEQRRKDPAPAADRKWTFWLFFMAALAIAWQILALFR
jgi:hypothetical protein